MRVIFTWKHSFILAMDLLGFDVCLESFIHEGVQFGSICVLILEVGLMGSDMCLKFFISEVFLMMFDMSL